METFAQLRGNINMFEFFSQAAQSWQYYIRHFSSIANFVLFVKNAVVSSKVRIQIGNVEDVLSFYTLFICLFWNVHEDLIEISHQVNIYLLPITFLYFGDDCFSQQFAWHSAFT